MLYILNQIKTKTNVIFILSLNNKQPIVAGKATSADEVLRAAGGNNLANQ